MIPTWSIGAVVVDAKRGRCVVVAIDAGSVLMKDEQGNEFKFAGKATSPAVESHKRRTGAWGKAIDERLLAPAVLGFLSARATLYAEIQGDKQDSFNDRYHFSPADNMGCLSMVKNKKWNHELRIRISAVMGELEGLGIADAVLATSDQRIFEVNNNRFWWRLAEMGFRLGNAHDIDSIRSGVPAPDVGEFERGRGIPNLHRYTKVERQQATS